MWHLGRGSQGCSSCGSYELTCERVAMSTYHPSVHHSEFAAGRHRQRCECGPLQTHSTAPLYEAYCWTENVQECLVSIWLVTCTVISTQVSIEDACDSSTSIGTYSLLLNSYIGRTMLEFQVKTWSQSLICKCYFFCSYPHKSWGVMW